MRPFAVLTNDVGRLDCWARRFLVDGDDSSLRCVQDRLGVRYDERAVPRADPAAIRSRWLLAPSVSPDGTSWHAAVGPRLDRLVPRECEWSGCVLPNPDSIWRSPAATLAGGAAAPVRLDELPAYGGALDWEELSFLEDESVKHPRRRIVMENDPDDAGGFQYLPDRDLPFFGPVSVDFALRPDPATPGGVVLSAAQTFEPDLQNVSPAFATNRTLRAEVPLLPGQTALFGARLDTVEASYRECVPVLSSIPLLGCLFTGEFTTTNAGEAVLLVRYTPRRAADAEGKSHADSADGAKEPSP